MRVALSLLTALALLVAGCSDGGQKVEDDGFDDFDVKATDQTGIILGVVVDETITPIAGVQVVLDPTGQNATTNAKGEFAFGDLPAGTYFVKASRLGYESAQQSIEVVAGVEKPPVTKIQLQSDPSSLPYFEEYVFEGFIECSGTFVAVGFAACSFVNTVNQIGCEESGVCTGNITNDQFLVEYPLSDVPDWMQSEMVWQSTQSAGGEMSLLYSWDGPECDPFLCDHETSGKSPLLLTMNGTEIEEVGFGAEYPDLMVRVFNKGLSETDPCVDGAGCAPGGGLGFTFQQSFKVYTHVFYGFTPEEDWRFTEKGSPVPPS